MVAAIAPDRRAKTARARERRAAARAAAASPVPRALDAARILERITSWLADGAAAARRAWTPRAGLPGPTRAHCPPPPQPCVFVQCRHHLSNVEGSARPGRRGPGWNLPPPTLRPLWLDGNAETCSLRVADGVAETGEPMPIAEIGAALSLSARQTSDALRAALARLGLRPADIAAFTIASTTAPRLRAARDARSAPI